MMRQERARKGSEGQVPFKGIGQLVKLGKAMIVTDKSTCCLPNMLLRVQIGQPVANR
jgi:hypothetical protein